MSRWITVETAELAVKAVEEENARLKAKVERLTKAGDAMMVIMYEDDGTTQDAYGQCYHLWNATKDGKDAQ